MTRSLRSLRLSVNILYMVQNPQLFAKLSERLGARLVPKREISNNGKCSIWSAELDDRAVVVKTRITGDQFYRETFRNELAVYEAFQRHPPPVRVPAVISICEEEGAIVLEYLAGNLVSADRYPEESAWTEHTVAEIVRVLEELRSYQGYALGSSITVLHGYYECWGSYIERGLYTEQDQAILDALKSRSDWCAEFNHGDPIPSNMLIDGGNLRLIDWEFGGAYLPLYDMSVLWVLSIRVPHVQTEIQRRCLAMTRSYQLCFAANLLRVVGRETWIHGRLPDNHPSKSSRQAMLAPLFPRARGVMKEVLAA